MHTPVSNRTLVNERGYWVLVLPLQELLSCLILDVLLSIKLLKMILILILNKQAMGTNYISKKRYSRISNTRNSHYAFTSTQPSSLMKKKRFLMRSDESNSDSDADTKNVVFVIKLKPSYSCFT